MLQAVRPRPKNRRPRLVNRTDRTTRTQPTLLRSEVKLRTDAIARSAEVKTAVENLIRPVVKLAPVLPTPESTVNYINLFFLFHRTLLYFM